MKSNREHATPAQVAARDALSERIARERAPGVVRIAYTDEFMPDSGMLYVFIVEDWEVRPCGEPVTQCAVLIGPRGGVRPLPSNRQALTV